MIQSNILPRYEVKRWYKWLLVSV